MSIKQWAAHLSPSCCPWVYSLKFDRLSFLFCPLGEEQFQTAKVLEKAVNTEQLDSPWWAWVLLLKARRGFQQMKSRQVSIPDSPNPPRGTCSMLILIFIMEKRNTYHRGQYMSTWTCTYLPASFFHESQLTAIFIPPHCISPLDYFKANVSSTSISDYLEEEEAFKKIPSIITQNINALISNIQSAFNFSLLSHAFFFL